MDSPVHIEFEWSDETLAPAFDYHWRVRYRLAARILLGAVGVLFMLCAIALLFADGFSLKFILSLLFAQWAFTGRIISKWEFKRNIRKNPGNHKMVAVDFTPDRVRSQMSELGGSDVAWEVFERVVHTPSGFLLYPNTGTFRWIPHHAFENEDDIQRLSVIAKANAKKYEEMV